MFFCFHDIRDESEKGVNAILLILRESKSRTSRNAKICNKRHENEMTVTGIFSEEKTEKS